MTRAIVVNACKVSLVVGTALNLLNQGPSILAGFEGFDWPRGIGNYLIPFCVSSWSAWRATREETPPR